jgi:hypothetical protein
MRFLRPAFHNRPDDLESRIGLAGPGRHDEQEAILTPGDPFGGSVDGGGLVIAGGFAAAVRVVVL